MMMGCDDDFVRWPITPLAAKLVADKLDCVIPTKRVVHEIFLDAYNRGTSTMMIANEGMQGHALYQHPQVGNDARDSAQNCGTGFNVFLDNLNTQDMTTFGVIPGRLVAGHRKEVIISGDCSSRHSAAVEEIDFYGFRESGGKNGPNSATQDTPAHNLAQGGWMFEDYSQGSRLIHRTWYVRPDDATGENDDPEAPVSLEWTQKDYYEILDDPVLGKIVNGDIFKFGTKQKILTAQPFTHAGDAQKCYQTPVFGADVTYLNKLKEGTFW